MSGIALIVAHDRARAIGREGRMPWHLPDDLKHFRALTMGGIVLMGRRTWDSIGRPLAGRDNWVLTRDPAWTASGARVWRSFAEALAAPRECPLWVIGGGDVYRLALGAATRIESTEIDTVTADADTWFPEIDERDWSVAARIPHAVDARHAHAFEFVTRIRRG